MARDAGGNYTAPANSWNPSVSGTQVNSDDWNATQADYEVALTESCFLKTDDVPAPPAALEGQIVVMHSDGVARKLVNSTLLLTDLPNTSGDIIWTGNHTFNGAGTFTVNQSASFTAGTFSVSSTLFTVSAAAEFTSTLNPQGAVTCGTTLQVTGTATFNDGTLAVNCVGPADFAQTVNITGVTTVGTLNAIAVNTTDLTVTNPPTFTGGLGDVGADSLQVGTTGAPSAGSITVENDVTVGGATSLKSTSCDDLTAANDIISTAGVVQSSGDVIAGGDLTPGGFYSWRGTIANDATISITPPEECGVFIASRVTSTGNADALRSYVVGSYDAIQNTISAEVDNKDVIHGTIGGAVGETTYYSTANGAAPAGGEIGIGIQAGQFQIRNNQGTSGTFKVTFF